MHLVFSAPTGFNTRELLFPLKELLEQDSEIKKITVISPAAPWHDNIFHEYGPKFSFVKNVSTAAEYQRLFLEIQPALIVTPTAGLDSYDVPLLEGAKAANVRMLTFVSSWDNVYKMERLKRFNKPYVLADFLVVWNESMAAHLRRIFPEYPAAQIAVVGSPRFDFFKHHDRIPTRSDLYDYLGFTNKEVVLIHLGTTELYPMEYIVRTIREALDRGVIKQQVHLYASVHPGGDMRKHQDYAEKYNVTVRYSFGRRDQSPLPEFLYNPTREEAYMLVALFKYSAVLVNHSSTVALESFAADVPVINVKYGQSWDWWRWRRSMVYRDFNEHYAQITAGGATTIVNNPTALVSAINRYLEHPEAETVERAATLRKIVTTTDGTASQQLLNVIKQQARS